MAKTILGKAIKDSTGKTIGYTDKKGVARDIATDERLPSTQPTVDRTPAIGSYQQAQNAARVTEESQLAIRREADEYAAQMRQARIDAINQSFAPRIARQVEENAGQMSRVAALNFNKGIVGSGVDTTKTGEQKNLNDSALRAIEDEKAILINEAFGYADELAKSRAETLTAEARERAAGNVEYQKGLYDKAIAALTSFGKGGVSIDDLKKKAPDVYNDLIKVGGLSDMEIDSLLNEAGAGKVIKTEIAGGKVVNVIQRPDGTIDVKSYNTDITDGEEFQSIDGVGYGMKRDASGNLVLRKLTEKSSSGSGGLTPYQQFSATQSIAKDTQARTEQAREMARQSQLIQQSYNNIINGGDRSLNTQAIITSFNKILDPSSVVRESEYDRTSEGQSLLARLEGKVQNIASGGAGVTPATLKEASDIANKYLAGAKKSVEQQNERARQMALQFGLNPDFVTSTGNIGDGGVDPQVKELMDAGYSGEQIKQILGQ